MKKLIYIMVLAFALVFQFDLPVQAQGFESDPYVYLNDVDNPSTVEQIQLELSVYDQEDGNLTPEIYVVSDNYTGNEDKLGDFVVVYGVTDSGNLESTIAIIVRNVDVNAPEFVVNENSLKIKEGSNISLSMPDIKAIDQFEGDITSRIEITGLDLIDTNTIGSYTLIYTVSDSSGNEISETFIVEVVDGTAPVLNGPDEIIKRYDYILTNDFFLSYFSATDDKDGLITNRIEIIENEYSGNGNITGTYKVVLEVSDNADNVTRHEFVIRVDSKMYPLMIIDQYTFIVSNQDLFSDEIVIDTLKYLKDIPNDNYIFDSLEDTYEEYYSATGTYHKKFHLTGDTGDEYDRYITFKVIQSDFNIISESPNIISKASEMLMHYWWAFLGGALVVIGTIKKYS